MPAWLGALGAGIGAGAAAGAAMGLIRDWMNFGLPNVLKSPPSPGTPAPKRAERLKSKLRKLGRALAEEALDALKEAAGGAAGAIIVSNLVAAALAADIKARQELWIRELSLPTFEALDYLYGVLINIIGAGVIGDAVSGTDVASDILESMLDSIFESAFADTIAKLWSILTPTESVDDDEIRDIVNAGGVNTPSDIALFAMLSGLERYSAFAEIYTGFLEGLFGYYRYLSDFYGDWARRLMWAWAPKLYYLWYADKFVHDLFDSAYWILEATDAVVNYARRVHQSLLDYWVAYKTGEIDWNTFAEAWQWTDAVMDALMEWIDYINASVNHIDFGPLIQEIEAWRTMALGELDRLYATTMEKARTLMGDAVNTVRRAYEVLVK